MFVHDFARASHKHAATRPWKALRAPEPLVCARCVRFCMTDTQMRSRLSGQQLGLGASVWVNSSTHLTFSLATFAACSSAISLAGGRAA